MSLYDCSEHTKSTMRSTASDRDRTRNLGCGVLHTMSPKMRILESQLTPISPHMCKRDPFSGYSRGNRHPFALMRSCQSGASIGSGAVGFNTRASTQRAGTGLVFDSEKLSR